MLPDLSALAGPPGGPDSPDAPGAGDPVEILKQMLDLADQYRQAEPDEADKSSMEQARTLLQKLLAKDQQEKDGLLQGKMPPSAMRRALGNQGGGY